MEEKDIFAQNVITGSLEYEDPDKDYEILDTGSEVPGSPTSSATTTSATAAGINNINAEFFDYNFAEVESTWTLSTSETENTDYCYNADNTSIKIEEFDRCVIVDIINNKVQRCINSVSHPIKQLQGTCVCSSHFNFD
ncbi:7614_t:CDS:2 [Ambispora gerdemannii]|uniref:7614_t:CDS:1 n=1 Tax=Ambispora gerdemannii TaxID=144530 RepID=A0A9N9AR24_9GLOM|nr:7614_t:CDS:2 [Ambispora gerdemannii]